MASLFEEMGGTYTLGTDDFYYPNLSVPEDTTPQLGKYGRMRRSYLKEHREGIYTGMLLSGKLNTHLCEIDEAAHAQLELLMHQMARKQGITEDLKAGDQMAWVGAMNQIRSAAEEVILQNLIYT